MSRRRTSVTPATPLDDEDLLREILLRLSPKPWSLPRASLVCKLWHNILSDAQFLNRFRKHHRKPPLLGFFVGDHYATRRVIAPLLDPPDRIQFACFSVPCTFNTTGWNWKMADCRHSLAVLINRSRREIVVWDPLTSQHHRFNFPPGLNIERLNWSWHAAVLCVDTQDGHVHGDCFSSPFKVVLICGGYKQASAWLYESASGVWGNVVSTTTTDTICSRRHSVLVGNTLYWLFSRGDVLAFDFERQRFDVIEKPADGRITSYRSVQHLRTEDGGLGLAVLLDQRTIKLWERKSDSVSVVGWVLLQKTIPLDGVFPRIPLEGMFPQRIHRKHIHFVGYDADTNVIVLSTMIGNFTLQLDSMQIRHIMKRNDISYDTFYPYTNFYTAGRGVGWKWLDLKL
uniref:Uncharacterized protein n=3 Tax=Avena sativa TaxID=4498 RepID=A0ACD5Y9F4_AVESA